MTMEGQNPAAAPTDPVAPPTTPTDPAAQQNALQQQERAQIAESQARGEEPAERPTDVDQEHNIFGQSLGGRRELGGGGAIQEHTLDAPPAQTRDPLRFQRRYMSSRLYREAGPLIARAPDNIGFWGDGDTYRGNGGILIDVDTLEKHRFPDGYRFEGDAVYANSRDLPAVLTEGDLARNLSGENAPTRR